MLKKDQYAIAAVLGIGALFVLWYLSRQQAPSATAETTDGPVVTASDGSAAGSYPNSAPPQMGDIAIGGSPINLTYNQLPGGQGSLPTLHVAAPNTGGTTPAGCCDDCDAAGPISQLNISSAGLKKQSANLDSYTLKLMH